MLSDMVVDRFLDMFPAIAYGKIWCRMKHKVPTRPWGDARGIATIAWVSREGARHMPPDLMGILYVVPGGKVVYWPYEENGEISDIGQARYVNQNVMAQAVNGWVAYDNLGEPGGHVSVDDQCAMLDALHE